MTWAEARITADPRGLDVGDYAFISSRALRGYPPAAIAKMIGRPLETVQEAMFMAPEREVRMPVLKLAAPVVEVVPSPPGIPDRPRQIIEEISARYGFTSAQLTGERRYRALIVARHHAVYDIRSLGSFSYPQIGMMFNCDHTTMVGAFQSHLRRVAAGDPRLRDENPVYGETACC